MERRGLRDSAERGSGPMSRRLQFSYRRQGTMLVAYLLLIPFALSLLVLLQSRIVASLADNERQQARVQARLLAESALALLRENRQVLANLQNKPIHGFIAGAGEY